MRKADNRRVALEGSPEQAYWAGYMMGLRRNYHGEHFGTEEDHRRRLRQASNRRDQKRRRRGEGYRDGFQVGQRSLESRQDLLRALLRQRAWAAADLAHQLNVSREDLTSRLAEGEERLGVHAWQLVLAMWHDPAFAPADLQDPTTQ